MMQAHTTAMVAMAATLLLVAACDSGRHVRHIEAPDALGPYSAVVVTDDTIYVAGKIGDPTGTFEHEVQTTLDAIEHELKRSGATLADLLTVTVYLTDLDQFSAFNAAYEQRVPAPFPARAVVEVSRLPGGARIEIQVTAVRR